jgi:hypothetical protein
MDGEVDRYELTMTTAGWLRVVWFPLLFLLLCLPTALTLTAAVLAGDSSSPVPLLAATLLAWIGLVWMALVCGRSYVQVRAGAPLIVADDTGIEIDIRGRRRSVAWEHVRALGVAIQRARRREDQGANYDLRIVGEGGEEIWVRRRDVGTNLGPVAGELRRRWNQATGHAGDA